MPQSLSAQRGKLRALDGKVRGLMETFLGREPLLPGCVYTLRRRCGKPTCRCARGELHATQMLSYRGEGRPQNVTPRPGELTEFKRLTGSYQRFRRARAQLVKLHREMLGAIHTIEALRVQEGERRFRALRSRASSPGRTGSAAKGRSRPRQ